MDLGSKVKIESKKQIDFSSEFHFTLRILNFNMYDLLRYFRD